MTTGADDGGAQAVSVRDQTDDAEHEARIDEALGGAASQQPLPSDDDAVATRDLLAEIADRDNREPAHPSVARGARTFVAWLLGTTALVVVLLLAVLWWLDPISVTGRTTRFSVVENGGVRQAKLDLMEELKDAPDVLVLGSSRSMKLDPEEIGRVSGATAFNGGVSGGTTQDIYLYARYAEELWGGDQGTYPHLVIGVVNDVFRYTGTAAFDPRLKRFMPSSQTERHPLDIAKALLQAKTVEAAGRSVNRVVRRDGVGALLKPEERAGRIDAALATTGKQRGNQRENLSPRGMQLFKPSGDYSKPVEARVEAQMRDFVRRSFEADAGYNGMTDEGRDLLERTIRMANRNGDVPTLWVTPYQPTAYDFLPKAAYEERNANFRKVVRELQADKTLRFEFVDLDDLASFGGDPKEFYDGIHMTEKNTAKVIAELQRRGVLTRPAAQ